VAALSTHSAVANTLSPVRNLKGLSKGLFILSIATLVRYELRESAGVIEHPK
jgi:hypothetical protein